MEVKTVQDKVIVGLSVAVVSLVSIFAGMLISNHFNKDKSNLDAKLEVNQPVENDKQPAVNQTVKEAKQPILSDREKRELDEAVDKVKMIADIIGWRFSNDELSRIYNRMLTVLARKCSSSNVVSVIRNEKDDVLQRIEKDKKEIGSERLKQRFIEKMVNRIIEVNAERNASQYIDGIISDLRSGEAFDAAYTVELTKNEIIREVEKLKHPT